MTAPRPHHLSTPTVDVLPATFTPRSPEVLVNLYADDNAASPRPICMARLKLAGERRPDLRESVRP